MITTTATTPADSATGKRPDSLSNATTATTMADSAIGKRPDSSKNTAAAGHPAEAGPVLSGPRNVYQMIAAVAGELAQVGIAKTRSSEQGAKYKFRGIDDVYNVVGPILAKHGLVILPRCKRRECIERVSAQGRPLFCVTLEVEVEFVSSEDGSRHTVVMFGEAFDSGDKATNKAISAAYKYAMFQAFCIPTEGDNDADATSHDVMAEKVKAEGRLSPEQINTIKALAAEVGANISVINDYYHVGGLEQVPVAAYPSIIRLLEKKRKPAPPGKEQI